jgi:hypothetical protein
LEKNGGKLMLRSHVESIKVSGEGDAKRATGIVLRGGRGGFDIQELPPALPSPGAVIKPIDWLSYTDHDGG